MTKPLHRALVRRTGEWQGVVDWQLQMENAMGGPKVSTISVFGSSRAVESGDDYRLARELGAALAQAGFAVATGGYGGTMEAVSRGAMEAGGV